MTTTSDETLTTIDQSLRAQLGAVYERLPRTEQERGVALVRAIQRPDDVALDVRSDGAAAWTVTICTADAIGALSVVAGLFTAYQLDIARGDIFTVRLPAAPAESSRVARRRPGYRLPTIEARRPRQLLFDIFEVRSLVAPAPDLWERLAEDLTGLVRLLAAGEREQARDTIIDRVSQVFAAAESGTTTLLPVHIDVATEPEARATRLRVRSADTPGFLFAFTNALAGFTINVERAEIRTQTHEAADTFWVTDLAGRALGDERQHELRVAATLIKQFTHLLPRSPDPGQALRQFNALVAQMLTRPQWTAELANLENPAVLETLASLMGVSRFLWEDFLRMQHENLFPVLVDPPSLRAAPDATALRADLTRRLAAQPGLSERVAALNSFKDREMFRIDLRHLTGQTDFTQFSVELSDLAEVVIAAAADLAHAEVARQTGPPRLVDGQPCPWTIAALGKFGGCELGFGSDLELVVVYGGEGRTAGPDAVENGVYFSRFVQALLSNVISRQAGIFEIDLRLRPYGKAGNLATSLDGFARYYAEDGDAEQFERLALVKLRPVAGDAGLGARVEAARDRFVYAARPLDLANIRRLRRRQATELVPRGAVNAKHSAGGLVDVEYFVQARQIMAGHADRSTRVTNTLEAIGRLTAGGHLSPARGEELAACYGFLRRLIDALRVVRGNAKDLTIPPPAAREFAYLAHRLGHDGSAALREAIGHWMGVARALWDEENRAV